MSIRRRLDRLAKSIGAGPRIAAAVVEGATGRVVQVLRGPAGFEPAPGGMTAADLPPGCELYPFDPDTSYIGCVNPQTGAAAVTSVCGIDLDVVLGRKPGLPPGCGVPPGVGGKDALEVLHRWQAREDGAP
jgi:hypothetical protein